MPCHPVLERASSAAWTEPAAASKNWCSTPGCQSLVNVRRRASAEKGRCWESLHAQVEKKSHATISEYISFQTHYSHVCNCMQPVMLNFQTEYLVSHSYRGMGMYLFWQNKMVIFCRNTYLSRCLLHVTLSFLLSNYRIPFGKYFCMSENRSFEREEAKDHKISSSLSGIDLYMPKLNQTCQILVDGMFSMCVQLLELMAQESMYVREKCQCL